MVFTTPLVAGPGPLTLAEHIGNQGGLEASALGRRADADLRQPRGRHRETRFGGLRGRGRLGPLLLRGRRRAPVEPRELPVELTTTTAALTFVPSQIPSTIACNT